MLPSLRAARSTVTGQKVGAQNDVLLLKFSPDSSLEWKRRWDGGGSESGKAVRVGSDGAVYVTGGVATPNGTSPGAGGFDAALVRIAR